jgi:hypothetical protein
VLDPDFEAFQAGYQAPPAPPSFFQAPLPGPSYVVAPLAKPAPQAVPDWALDFQRLNISAPPPVAQEQFAPRFAAPAIMNSGGSAMGQSFAPAFESSYSYLGHGYGAGVGMGYMEHQEQSMGYMDMPPQAAMTDGGFGFDTEAFERAFDVAAADASQLDTATMQPESEYEALMRSDEEFDQIMSGIQADASDQAAAVVPQPVQEEAPQNDGMHDEGDQLSQTAKQLLESVSHEASDKFAQSSFLELMRRLRDKEVRVEGEDFIEACTPWSYDTANAHSRRPTTLQTRQAWPARRSKSPRA